MAEQLKIERLAPGDGKTFPAKGDLVTLHCTGKLTNGKVFWTTATTGKPFQTYIGVGQVIQGWDQGVPQLSLGEKARLTIPSHMGYGERGFPPVVPPSSTLIFDVELLSIDKE